jgi:hypothetical protein
LLDRIGVPRDLLHNMRRIETFMKISLGLAVASTALYWFAYLNVRHVTANRKVATTMPMPLNGFGPSLRGVSLAGLAGQSVSARSVEAVLKPRLLIAVSDTCPGSRAAVSGWIDWVRKSPHRGYLAVIVSLEGRNYLSQLADAFARHGVEAVTLDVTEREEFVRSSGMLVTPMLLGVDRHGYARVIGYSFSEGTRRVLEEFLDADENALEFH